MLLYVNVLDSYFDYITCFEKLGGMLDESVAHLGDVKKAVVVNTDINEATEVNNISYSTLKLHFGLKIVDVENIGRENGSRSVVTNVTSGLFKLGNYVLKGGLTAIQPSAIPPNTHPPTLRPFRSAIFAQMIKQATVEMI